MSKAIAIELNDSGIIVSDDQRLLVESPGYIINLNGQQWLGKEARDRALLYPNECNHQFWSELARSQANTANHEYAKLALTHLSTIWQKVSASTDAVILTVPATFTKTGLGLLLGICKELTIPVQAMIHHAVLAPRQADHSGATLHVDMQLHHTAITQLREQDNDFIAHQSEVLEDIGVLSMHTLAAEFVAQTFISSTRLDPMHSAELEQQLFNNLPAWLEIAQTQSTVRCQLEYQNSSFEVIINSQELKNVFTPQLNKIINILTSLEPSQTVIACVSELFDKQFGFVQHAANSGIMVRPLCVGYHAYQSLHHTDQLLRDGSQQIYLNKQLPYTELTDTLATATTQRPVPAESPTHILYRNQAFPLEDRVYLVDTPNTGINLLNSNSSSQQNLLTIYKQDTELVIEIANGQEITVNDQVVQNYRQPLVGDCIRIASSEDELTFIKVEK